MQNANEIRRAADAGASARGVRATAERVKGMAETSTGFAMRSRMIGALLLAATAMSGCGADRLTVPNYNNPTDDNVASDPGALQLTANGLLVGARSDMGGWISGTGRLGREAYSYTPTEGRNTTTYLMGPQDPTRGAGNSFWSSYYSDLRNIFDFNNAVTRSSRLSDIQKEAALGYSETLAGLALNFIVTAHGSFGGPVEILENPRELAPWVSRDSIYNTALARLEAGRTHLLAGGSAFPFRLNAGFSGFNTPAGFLKVNRAIAARVNAYRASYGVAGCGERYSATCYQLVLDNIAESFLNPSDLSSGPKYIYSTAAGDAQNPLSNASSSAWVAHPSILPDAQLQAGGAPDQRYIDKVTTMDRPVGPGGAVPGIETDQDFIIFSGPEDPIPMINSEELLLLRAEARWFTGDKAGAIADLDIVRTTSGNLPPSTLTTGSSDDEFITALLYERRYSLLIMGHRWVDVRRFGKLETLPLDVPEHVRFDDLIIPQSECLIRNNEPPSCS